MKKYLIFRPGYPGFIWAEISADGKTDNIIVHNIIQAMKRGKYTKKGYDIRCVPNSRNRYGSLTAKKKDCVKLGDLFALKRDRGNSKGLCTIKDKDRFKGRDWESDRTTIESEVKDGVSISQIARRLGVTPSALSKANKRYKFYARKQQPCR
jgi:hypothetical protein